MSNPQLRDAFKNAAAEMLDGIDTQRAAKHADQVLKAKEAAAANSAARRAAFTRAFVMSVAIAPMLAAAAASLYDVAHLVAALGGALILGALIGLAIDFAGGFFLWQLYATREDPGEAVRHYNKASRLLWFSVILNGFSGLVTAGPGVLGYVVAAATALMPLIAKLVCLQLILTGSLSGELLKGARARRRVAGMSKGRQAAALDAYETRYKLDIERSVGLAELDAMRTKSSMHIERQRVAIQAKAELDTLLDDAISEADFRTPVSEGAPAPLKLVKTSDVAPDVTPDKTATDLGNVIPDVTPDVTPAGFGFTPGVTVTKSPADSLKEKAMAAREAEDLTAGQLAERFNRDPRTIRRWIAEWEAEKA